MAAASCNVCRRPLTPDNLSFMSDTVCGYCIRAAHRVNVDSSNDPLALKMSDGSEPVVQRPSIPGFIEVTISNTTKVLIGINHIVDVSHNTNAGVWITYGRDQQKIEETYEQVLDLIKEAMR